MELRDDLDAGEIHYYMDQDSQTGVITVIVQATAFEVSEALQAAASALDAATIEGLAEGFKNHRHTSRELTVDELGEERA